MLTMKKYLVGVIFGLASLVFICGTTHAYYAEYTISSVENAGLVYTDTPSATLTYNGGSTNYTSSSPNLTVAANALTETSGKTGWNFTSAGNLWGPSPTSPIGLAVSLAAGTYSITALGGGFTYDSFGFTPSSPYYNTWLWLLQIVNGTTGAYTPLGNTVSGAPTYTSAADAFSHLTTTSITLTLSSPTTMWFYVWDNNSIDNSGNLRFSVSSVPLPSSLLLALSGLPAMALFRVRRFFSKK